MEYLISNTDFGILLSKCKISDADYRTFRFRYDFFLQETVHLGMFFPGKLVDGVWILLHEPVFHGRNITEVVEYENAKANVFFEGFEYVADWYKDHLIAYDRVSGKGQFKLSDFPTIEDMIGKKELKLTQTAKTLLGL